MDEELRMCPNCKNMVSKWEIVFTRDCHGIPFRPVCQLCYAELMRDGYDGSTTQKLMNVSMMNIEEIEHERKDR
ncbi:MAG: hypothetical protein IKS07_02265 [Lachnospiraceae bacterium]|nr:hypothetical protein [Lachnospiraceae bacterium]